MHQSSYVEMQKFFIKYVQTSYKYKDSILDIGSYDVNGTYKNLIPTNCLYTGLDIVNGPNVDTVASSLYSYPFPDNKFDFVISGQCMEHVQDLHRWIQEVVRVTSPNGYICLIAPSSWEEHRHPIDCWRILPDGMKFLFNLAGIKEIEIYNKTPDCVGIGRKI